MDKDRKLAGTDEPARRAADAAIGEIIVHDRLPDSFEVTLHEAKWLLAMLAQDLPELFK